MTEDSRKSSLRERLSEKYDHPEVKEAKRKEVLKTWVKDIDVKYAAVEEHRPDERQKAIIAKVVKKIDEREKKQKGV
ncbi:MAG: hypothetical protein V1744_06905 [Candidatus Altiarchaeota archaeon]